MPWVNGRVEKLVGTLKEGLNQLAVTDCASLNVAIAEFRCWYNVLRPHHYLTGHTPFEAWHKRDPFPVSTERSALQDKRDLYQRRGAGKVGNHCQFAVAIKRELPNSIREFPNIGCCVYGQSSP
jgi:hypothetical protein